MQKIHGVHHQIQDIIEDAEGNIWVGTDGAGIFKIRSSWFQIYGEAEGLPQETVLSVCGDWVAPRAGGLGRLNRAGAVEMLPEHESNSVTSLMEDGKGGVWLGTAGGRLIHRSATGVIEPSLTIGPAGTQVRVLHRDQTGNLWIGAFPYGLFLLPTTDPTSVRELDGSGVPKSAVTAIAEDAGGSVWFGTDAGELFCRTNGGFQRFGTAEGFTGFTIGALLPDPKGGLWVGTLGGGLGRFQGGRIKFLGRSDGLADDVVSQLVEDNAGWLWIGGSRGLARVRPGEVEAVLEGRKQRMPLTHYGQPDGLANVQCSVGSQPSAWRTPDGRLRFATSRGVVSFDPTALPMNLRPPPLVLESVMVDGVQASRQSNLRLAHDFRKLEFRYAAMSLAAPEKVLFHRRLLGFDEGWIEDGKTRTASYPRLPPGQYTFQFTACNNDAVWNDEILSLRFEVIPAVWQTLSFKVTMAIGFAAVVGGSVLLAARLRMRRKLARLEQANALERERTRISRDLHDDLGARLTQMALLTDLAADDPTASQDLRGQIRNVATQARGAVQSLDETVWMINPQKDTLAHVIGYVARYAEQFFLPTPILCRQDICRQPPECMMPGKLRRDILMLVKEALNNVLKHSQAAEVWLRIAVRGSAMRITVRDNGRGFEPTAANPRRHGLENMLRRAESAGIKVTVRSRPGRGTLVALRVKLPLPDRPLRNERD
jgi:signal transduction histidine kinase/streptogramin lyase